MQSIATLVWAFAIICTPIILLVAAYVSYIDQKDLGETAARLFFAILGYLLITAGSVPILFIAVFSSAHSLEGDGRSITGTSLWLFAGFASLYLCLSYLLICVARRGFIKPWKIFDFRRHKEVSIFSSNDI